MSAINGTAMLLYANGTVIAMQKGISVALNIDLPDATNKESAGWNQHILGSRDAKIDFSSLAGMGTTGMSAKALMNFILNQQSILVSILGLGLPIVGEVNMSSLSIDAPLGNVMTLSGNFTVNGPLFWLANTQLNMITDPDAGTHDYDTLTVSDISITSAIKSTAGAKKCDSNTISVVDTGVYKLAVYLTLNSGQAPTVGIWDNSSAYISNTQALVSGLNLVTLTATATDASASLRFSNSANGNWSTSPLYLFKV
jgi:hypothetical protein